MPITHRRFTVDEYHRMAATGILTADDRVELLDGEIVQMTPIGPEHASCVDTLTRLFITGAGERVIVRTQNPIVLGIHHEPEPDVVLARPRPSSYRDAHPGTDDVLLVAEVADASLTYDRTRKLRTYAAAGIPEVWIIDLTANQIELYRDPRDGGYTSRRIATRLETVAPTALPNLHIPIRELLG